MDITVLVIDDEEKLRRLLVRIIGLEGYQTLEAGSLAAGEKLIAARRPDIVLCDVKLPDGNGVAFTARIRAQFPATEVILLTAFGRIADGVEAMRNGASDYLVKGDDNERIIPLLARAASRIRQQRGAAPADTGSRQYGFDRIIGASPALEAAISIARKVAVTDTAVLLQGETGTGKEVFAQSIHAHSKRSNGPFIALNCSSFSRELLESELFGHKAGAFTGAARDHKGLIAEAAGGTLFLDEIGELPPELQPKLLRVLESGAYYRVGDTRQQTADVRLIAATHRDLSGASESGIFRSDLYYRIAVFTIPLPSLRERVKDIPALAQHFLRVYSARVGRAIAGIGDTALQALIRHAWPGNIRELKNVIERAVILEDGDTLTLQSLPPELQHALHKQERGLPAFSLAAAEQQHIRKVLAHTGGNKAEAARLMGIGIATLYRKIEEYGLKL